MSVFTARNPNLPKNAEEDQGPLRPRQSGKAKKSGQAEARSLFNRYYFQVRGLKSNPSKIFVKL